MNPGAAKGRNVGDSARERSGRSTAVAHHGMPVRANPADERTSTIEDSP